MVEVKSQVSEEEYELKHDVVPVSVVDPEVLPHSVYIGYAMPVAPVEQPVASTIPDFASVNFDDADPMIRDIVGPIMQNAWNHYQAGMQIIQRMQQNAGHY